jgi:hypothetical protein
MRATVWTKSGPGHPPLFISGKNLGHLPEGKTGRTTREEAWTSYRGESCENNQGRD